jgi:hypothetical protein
MFSFLNRNAHSTDNGTELLSSHQLATQPEAFSNVEESTEDSERAATYEELLPYLMLRLECKHQWPVEAILSERHRPVGLLTGQTQRRGTKAERAPKEDAGLRNNG